MAKATSTVGFRDDDSPCVEKTAANVPDDVMILIIPPPGQPPILMQPAEFVQKWVLPHLADYSMGESGDAVPEDEPAEQVDPAELEDDDWPEVIDDTDEDPFFPN